MVGKLGIGSVYCGYKTDRFRNIEEFREHCRGIAGAREGLPFLGHNGIVFKVMDKMFAMARLEPKDGIDHADLKCDPAYTAELRESYAGISPGHVKTTMLWHRVVLDSDVPDVLIAELIRHSVDEVLKAMPASKRREYERACSED